MVVRSRSFGPKAKGQRYQDRVTSPVAAAKAKGERALQRMHGTNAKGTPPATDLHEQQ